MNEQRIRAMYKARKKSHYKRLYYYGDPVYCSPEMEVARVFKISCAEVRRILAKANG